LDFGAFISVMRRWWWIVLLMPVVALTASLALSRFQPYQSQVRATVLIPGDTEDPGRAERPELMVLDDLPVLVGSRVFAEGVHQEMGATAMSVDEVQATLSASRYSRVLTVYITDSNQENVAQIGQAVSMALPTLINDYLVHPAEADATVRVIDPTTTPTRSRAGLALQTGVITVFAIFAGIVLALAADWLVALQQGRLSHQRQSVDLKASHRQPASDN
jgi:capsular polysaccharide biosynthesis protein